MKSKYIVCLGIAAIAFVAYLVWWNSPSREIRRMHDALLSQKTWHLHAVRYYQGTPPQTDDTDYFCPSFAHWTNQYTDYKGDPAVRETIRYDGAYYIPVNGRWTKGTGSAEIPECRHAPILEGDGITLPFAAIGPGTQIHRGAVRTIGSDNCRDYDFIVPTPYDMLHKDYRFTICITELDHLPRQTRRDPSISGHEDSVEYFKWGDLSEPPLPYGIQ